MSNDFNDFMNTPDDTGMYDTQDIQTNKVWAALSYVGILFILPLLVNGGQSRYAKYHANQGFILFLANIVVGHSGKDSGFGRSSLRIAVSGKPGADDYWYHQCSERQGKAAAADRRTVPRV